MDRMIVKKHYGEKMLEKAQETKQPSQKGGQTVQDITSLWNWRNRAWESRVEWQLPGVREGGAGELLLKGASK